MIELVIVAMVTLVSVEVNLSFIPGISLILRLLVVVRSIAESKVSFFIQLPTVIRKATAISIVVMLNAFFSETYLKIFYSATGGTDVKLFHGVKVGSETNENITQFKDISYMIHTVALLIPVANKQ